MKIQFKVVSPPTPEPAFACYRYVDADTPLTLACNKLRAAWCGTAALSDDGD